MQKIVKEFLISAVILVILDMTYVYVNKSAFENLVASIQRTVLQVNVLGVILTYVLLVAGLFYFIIRRNRPIEEAFMLGILVYGVVEATNYSIFTPLKI